MSDKKISDLTELTIPVDADEVAIVDDSATETKRLTWANIKATLKTYFDALYTANNILPDQSGESGKYLTTDGSDPSWDTGGSTDSNAIHDNVASEISAIAEKASPVNADLVIIEDSAASNAKKKVQVGNLPGGGGSSIMTGYAGTLVDVDNTASETDILTFTIPANDIADGDYINASFITLAKQTTGSTQTMTLKITYGADEVTINNAVNIISNAAEGTKPFSIGIRRVGTDLYVSSGFYSSYSFPLLNSLFVGGSGNLFYYDLAELANYSAIISNPGFTTEKDVTVKITFNTASADYYLKPQGAALVFKYGVTT